MTDRDSAPYRTLSTRIVGSGESNNCYRFRDRLTKPVLYQVACQQLVIDSVAWSQLIHSTFFYISYVIRRSDVPRHAAAVS